MATYTEGTTPVQIVRNRPWSLPMVWQTADTVPVPIDITAFTFAGTVRWSQHTGDANAAEEADLTFTTTDAAAGEFTVSLDATSTKAIASGTGPTVGITLTDGSGVTHDFVLPATVYSPQGVPE